MKHLKKLLAAALTFVMALTVSTVALAESGTITVNNAAKGETYAVYKVLDATINNEGGINYTGTIPESLEDYLEVITVTDEPNTYSAIGKKAGVDDEDLFNALKQFAADKEGVADYEALVKLSSFPNATASQVATGNSVTFSVDAGYYVVVSTQGTAVMIDSATNPAAVINEKNTTEPHVEKTVEAESYSIGDTIKYKVEFDSANYLKNEENVDRPVIKYTISDTLPPFLSGATVTKLTVNGADYKVSDAYPQFNTNKEIEIPWADYNSTTQEWTSKYPNGAKIVVEYEATLTSTTNIGKNSVNTITIKPTLGKPDGNEEEPKEKTYSDDAEIKTYAAALKKTDGTKALAGAEFTIKGLVAHEKEAGSGIWIVDSYKPTDTTVTPTTLTTDANGKLYIVGIAGSAEMEVTETKAPDGYNKLNGTKPLTPQLVETTSSKTTTWEKYDAKGNLIDSKTEETTEYTQNLKNLTDLDAAALEIVNHEGAELPETGGMGTTVLYAAGAALVVLGGIFLVTKKRMGAAE